MIFLPKLIVWILLFLTGDLLNIHKAFPRHTHFKPLSENRATHTVALQKGVYQPYISSMTIHFSISFFSIWQTMEKIQFSDLILEELFFFSTFNLFFDSAYSGSLRRLYRILPKPMTLVHSKFKAGKNF